MTGASTPYATRELAGTLVRQAIVAENGSSATVWTSSIVGGGPVGGVREAVVVAGRGGVGAAAPRGRARRPRSLTYGELMGLYRDRPPADAAARLLVR